MNQSRIASDTQCTPASKQATIMKIHARENQSNATVILLTMKKLYNDYSLYYNVIIYNFVILNFDTCFDETDLRIKVIVI